MEKYVWKLLIALLIFDIFRNYFSKEPQISKPEPVAVNTTAELENLNLDLDLPKNNTISYSEGDIVVHIQYEYIFTNIQ
jgi:hypothetical protein